jgi:flagellar biosynthesis protein
MTDDKTPKSAVALYYDGSQAPRVTAKGSAAVAEEIIAIARAHGVPLFENRELAGLLSTLELDDSIPEVLYRCIAQIIAFVYTLKAKAPEHWQPPYDPALDRGEVFNNDESPLLPLRSPVTENHNDNEET